MIRRRSIALVLSALALLPSAALPDEQEPVTVFAAASLRAVFDTVGAAFTAKTGTPVRFSYGGSDTLATQIVEGAPADVFASANDVQMGRVVDAGAAAAPRVFARNRLVTIALRGGPVRRLADLGANGVKLVLAAPTVPAGAYARRALGALHGGAFGDDFAARAQRNIVSEEPDVSAVAAKVGLGEADAGIVYTTDVSSALAPKVRILTFPPGAAPSVIYPVAITTRAANPAAARAFVAYLFSPAGRALLRAHGFEDGSARRGA